MIGITEAKIGTTEAKIGITEAKKRKVKRITKTRKKRKVRKTTKTKRTEKIDVGEAEAEEKQTQRRATTTIQGNYVTTSRHLSMVDSNV